MPVTIKQKLGDLAKDLNMQPKELAETVTTVTGEAKKHTSDLSEAELNRVFEHQAPKNPKRSLLPLRQKRRKQKHLPLRHSR